MIKKISRKIIYNPTYCYYLNPERLVSGGNFYRYCKEASQKKYPKLLKAWFHHCTGETLNLEHPRNYNEKIQWLKLHDTTPLKTRLTDKYLVRDWIAEQIGESHLIPLLGVWDSFDEIDFDELPEQFVLKANHGSGWNIVVKDKKSFDRDEAREKFDRWLNTNFAFVNGLELQYRDIPPKIIAETYIEQMDHNLLDYKIHCFHGEPKIIQIIGDRDLICHTGKEIILDLNWERQNWMYHTYDDYESCPQKPECFNEMIAIAKKLSSEFKYVRVDLYITEGKIYFGEMTFTPYSGVGTWGGDWNKSFSWWLDLK